MICRAEGCTNEAMPWSKDNPKELCGACHERDENRPVRLKRGPKPGGKRAPKEDAPLADLPARKQRARIREILRRERETRPHKGKVKRISKGWRQDREDRHA